jgi:hypothetical protein
VPTNSSKPTKNVIRDWALTPDMQIRGRAVVDQPDAHVRADDFIVTSKVRQIYRDQAGVRRALTQNSIYILED